MEIANEREILSDSSDSSVSFEAENLIELPDDKDFNIKSVFSDVKEFEEKFQEYCKKTFQVYITRTSKSSAEHGFD
jgi:hypothetical protein